jgi:TFIIF-interacting CTD phosphatase-like protein
MSKIFQIYVFTSAIQDYAKTIIDHLNSKKKYIQGFLHRSHCLETKRGMRIKDLRIIKNRDLSKIVMALVRFAALKRHSHSLIHEPERRQGAAGVGQDSA